MTEIVPFNFDDHEIRVIMIDDTPWWVAGDVCAPLEIKDTRQAVSRLDEDDRCTAPVIDQLGREQLTWVVNESGLYDLILDSRKPEAKRLRRWITSEVMPQIRKTGAYGLEKIDLPTALERYAAALREQAAATARAIEAENQVVELQPKAIEFDFYMDSGGLCDLGALAQALGGGRQRLIDRLRELGILVSREASQGGVRPIQYYMEQHWFEVKLEDTATGPKYASYATPKGASGVLRKLVEHGIGGRRWNRELPSEDALLRLVFPKDGDELTR